MSFDISLNDSQHISIEPGSSIIFVGANGSGKTRLAVRIEELLGTDAHRISAHRALNLNPEVAKITQEAALKGVYFGSANGGIGIHNRRQARWGHQGATHLLNDFQFLIQALFAEQAITALESHKSSRAGGSITPPPTQFEKLAEIWGRLLPHRKLEITGDNIFVNIPDSSEKYSASQMSDGERAIFYLIGQVLVAQENSLLIIDEPELHIHRSILASLWDELEAARPDCAFVFITHDLDFAATRAAEKYVLEKFNTPNSWEYSKIPEDELFTEELITHIMGSRRNILFVEGTGSSIDSAVYRAIYPDWMVVPRGSCTNVIRSVKAFNNNSGLTRLECRGLIDSDSRTEEEKEVLCSEGVYCLPVSEVENIFLLPSVSEAIALDNNYNGQELEQRMCKLKEECFNLLSDNAHQNQVIARRVQRRLDAELKKTDLSAVQDSDGFAALLAQRAGEIKASELFEQAKSDLEEACQRQDMELLLAIYDDKRLLSIASKHCRDTTRTLFVSWLIRALNNASDSRVLAAIREVMPDF